MIMKITSRATAFFLLSLLVLGLSACASWVHTGGHKQIGSVVDYLYPDAKEAPQLQAGPTYLRPPIRVGVAFVPGNGGTAYDLPSAERQRLLERVKAAFSKYPFIASIELIPTQYMRAKGGFTNLDQVARLFNVEVVALLSFDQVQFNDSNRLSVLYWTIVGAYLVHGDQYDIQTLVDASVFDVRSRKLLFRAPGTSQVKGSASMAGFTEQARAGRSRGFDEAIDQMNTELQAELERFKERIKTDSSIKVENQPQYRGGGALAWLDLLSLAGLALAALWARRGMAAR